MAKVDMTELYDNLPDNSHSARVEKASSTEVATISDKPVKKVVRGQVKTKKNEIRRLTDVFISEDVANVKDYIIYDVALPAIKKFLYDIVVNSLDMTLYGNRGSGKRHTADKVSFRDYSGVSSRNDSSGSRTRSVSGCDYDDIILETRADADALLSRMDEIMDEYGVVRVADMYDIVQLTPPHTANKYGWKNISDAKVIGLRGGGYTIDMPRAKPISRQFD